LWVQSTAAHPAIFQPWKSKVLSQSNLAFLESLEISIALTKSALMIFFVIVSWKIVGAVD